MKSMNLEITILAGLACGLAFAANAQVPKGWFAAGSHPKEYEMKLDSAVAHGGKGSASLKCIVAKPGGFGTLMQTFKADDYRGRRVRMSGYVRSADVADWAGLWLRVDGVKGETLSFDNMQDRAIKGTTAWKQCEIVLDVPEESQQLAFGILLNGTGHVWMDDIKFETVGKDVPVTGSSSKSSKAAAPVNLDFEG
jgi:hypothetical protein